MSFRCEKCHQVKRAGNMVVIETREKTYYEKQFERGQEIMVPVGAGFETVHEERWCQECIGPYEKPTRIAVEARRHGR